MTIKTETKQPSFGDLRLFLMGMMSIKIREKRQILCDTLTHIARVFGWIRTYTALSHRCMGAG